MDIVAIQKAIEQYFTADRVLLLMYLFNCAVQAMPEPNGGKLYRFLYSFAHLLAGNTALVRKTGKEARFHQDQLRPHPGEDPRMGGTYVS